MAPPNGSNNTAKGQINQADLSKEMWQEDHPMTTKSKTGVPPSTPQRYTGSAFYDAPFLAHTAPSGSFSSRGKSGRISPSKSRTPSPSKSASTAGPRKTILKKEQLAQMSPSVSFDGIQGIKDKSTPKSTVDLWKNYISPAIHGPCVVPLELKVSRSTLSTTSLHPFANVAL